MKQVYAPANSAEAHMLVHLLVQSGIEAHIHGEALQGGVGELPAASLLQILVPDEHYDEARRLLLEWERASSAAPTGPRTKAPLPLIAGLVVLTVGFFGGWMLKTAALSNAIPIDIAEDRVDQNGDGVDDLVYFYRVGARFAHKAEGDRNFDGRNDFTDRFDGEGIILTREADDNFDGFFETRARYRAGNATVTEVDTNKNGVADIKWLYIDGVLRREELHDNGTGVLARVNYYAGLRLTRSEIDLDRDGFLETVRSFDPFGEVVDAETRPRP